MIDICMALDQSVFSADSPLPFSDHDSAAKTTPRQYRQLAGYVVSGGYSILFLRYTSLGCCYFDKINTWISKFNNHDLKF